MFWLLINLSKEYINNVIFNVTYINLPQNKTIENSPQSQLKLELKTHGFKLLTYHIERHNININMNHLRYLSKNKYYYLPNNHLREIQLQLSNETELINIASDTIYFVLSNLDHKKVKVVPDINLNFKSGYNLSKPISVTPDSIEIIGPKSRLDSINTVETEPLQFKNISEDINKSVNLNLVKNNAIKYSKTKAQINIEVDKYTETNVSSKIEVINLPKGTKISILPKEVTIKYQVSLSNFNKVNAAMFQVQCNYAQAVKDSLGYLLPVVSVKPDFVSNIQITPERIEYLILK